MNTTLAWQQTVTRQLTNLGQKNEIGPKLGKVLRQKQVKIGGTVGRRSFNEHPISCQTTFCHFGKTPQLKTNAFLRTSFTYFFSSTRSLSYPQNPHQANIHWYGIGEGLFKPGVWQGLIAKNPLTWFLNNSPHSSLKFLHTPANQEREKSQISDRSRTVDGAEWGARTNGNPLWVESEAS